MNFANNVYLYLMPVVLIVVCSRLVYNYRKYKNALYSFTGRILVEKIVCPSVLKIYKVKNILVFLIFLLFLISLSGPQWGIVPQEVKAKGVDVIIGVDVSRSMLTEDVLPNRLGLTKSVIELLLNRLEGNRVGIITFAGIAFYQCPLTVDIKAAKYMLSFLDTDTVPYPGTKVGDCIAETLRVFKKYGGMSKVLLLFTDGEDHNSEIDIYLNEAKKNNIIIHTVGVGTPQGRPIPIRDANGIIVDYKKDRRGNIVTSKLNEQLLIKISQETGGKYFSLASNNLMVVDYLLGEINSYKKSDLKSNVYKLYKNRYYYFVYLLIFLFLLEIFLPDRWWAKVI